MASELQSTENWVTLYAPASKMFLYFFAGLICIPAGLYFMSLARAKFIFAGAILIIMGPILALKVCRIALSGGLILRYNAEKIHIPGLLGTRRLHWSDVKNVSIIEHRRYIFGFIKVGSSQGLYVHPMRGWKVYVPTPWAGLTQQEMYGLASKFESLRIKASEGTTSKPFTSNSAEPKNDYADAVVARYMARKKEEESAGFSSRPAPQQTSLQNGGVVFGKRLSPP